MMENIKLSKEIVLSGFRGFDFELIGVKPYYATMYRSALNEKDQSEIYHLTKYLNDCLFCHADDEKMFNSALENGLKDKYYRVVELHDKAEENYY